MKGVPKQAWVIGVATETQAENALVLSKSLKLFFTTRSLIVLVDSSITEKTRKNLRNHFDLVGVIDDKDKIPTIPVTESLFLFAFTLELFDQCVWISAKEKKFAVKNCDEIFSIAKYSAYRKLVTIISCGQSLDCMRIIKPCSYVFNSIGDILKSEADSTEVFLTSFVKSWCENNYPGKNLFLEYEISKGFVVSLKIDDNTNFSQYCQNEIRFVELHEPNGSHHPTNHFFLEWEKLCKTKVQQSLDFGISESRIKESVAVVGMSCRFPKSKTLEEFWNLLLSGCDGTSAPPEYRKRAEDNQEAVQNFNAGYLSVPVDEFDAKFFGISNAETIFLDPQQRLLHELVWEGLEDAAINPDTLYSSQTGVFIGSWNSDYKNIIKDAGHDDFYRTYMGTSIGAAAARISFLLGLTGPTVATDSGCSSSMVAVHMACKSLLSGESNLAFAAGLNLLLSRVDLVPTALSPDGRCKTFSANANGFGRADGCAVLVLKRFTEAVTNGDRIYAVIKGSAMTQEGITKSMGTPTVHCEALAMKQALLDADITPEQISYVEAHGTGTVVGDPLEIHAIAEAYGTTNRKNPLIIGSVKTNIGHTEATSGIAGLIKVILAMKHEIIPPHINLNKINPNINLDVIPAIIPVEPTEWKNTTEKLRRAGVSSFGITGTDVHVIVEEPPLKLVAQTKDLINMTGEKMDRPLHLIKFSAKSEEALNLLMQNWEKYLQDKMLSEISIGDICYTANTGRADFEYKAAIICKSKQDLLRKLKEEPKLVKCICRPSKSSNTTNICFLFTGQGNHYQDMAKSLYETSPIFKQSFDLCSNLLQNCYNIDIKAALWGSKRNDIIRTIYSQTSIFAVEYALLQLWLSWGIKPDFALGHSLGEFCAAICADILSVEDALTLVAKRSQLIDSLTQGKMLVIRDNKTSVVAHLDLFKNGDPSRHLDIAAVNSNEQTVVAGSTNRILEFFAFLRKKCVKCSLLDSTHAFHSNHMDSILESYRQVAKTIGQSNKGLQCQYISGMKGTLVDKREVDEEYWVNHTREAVLFAEASKTAVALGCSHFIEIGPQPVLSIFLASSSSYKKIVCLPSLRRTGDDWVTILHSLAKLYISDIPINWHGLDKYYSRNKIRLPTYPFIRKSIWPEQIGTQKSAEIHPLLGTSLETATRIKIFEKNMQTKGILGSWVTDHCIGENVVFPAAGYLEMCLAAGAAVFETRANSLSKPKYPVKVENLSIDAPLCFPRQAGVKIQTVIELANNTQTCQDIKIIQKLKTSSSNNGKWLQHAKATFDPVPQIPTLQTFSLESTVSSQDQSEYLDQIYSKLSSIGLNFGPVFRSVEKLWWKRESNEVIVKIRIPVEDENRNSYIVHPVILDAFLQAIMMLLILKKSDQNQMEIKKLFVPIKIGSFLYMKHTDNETNMFVRVTQNRSASVSWDSQDYMAVLLDFTGTPMAVMNNVEVIDTNLKVVESTIRQQQCVMPDLWEECWKPRQGPLQNRLDFSKVELPVSSNTNRIPTDTMFHVHSKLVKFSWLNMLHALYGCGWDPKVGQTFETDKLRKELNILEKHRLYFGYIMRVLEEEKMIKRIKTSESLKCTRDENCVWEICNIPYNKADLLRHLNSSEFSVLFATTLEVVKLLEKVGKKFADILQGKQDALAILFPEDNVNNPSTSAFYDEHGKLFGLTNLTTEVLTRRIKSFKEASDMDGCVLRILEIGAGTGAFSNILLQVLEDLQIQYEYTYTDISAGFFSAAEQKFEKYLKNLQFKKLNIENDPLTQGFSPEYFDYIYASEVMHATRNIAESLENVRLLLRQNGKLDFIETTVVNRYVTYLVGVLPGYWRFEDLSLRPTHCTMSCEKWEWALSQSGFGVDEIHHCLMKQNSMICTYLKPKIALFESKFLRKQNWLCFQPHGWENYFNKLKNKLESINRKVFIVRKGNNVKLVKEDESYCICHDYENQFKDLFKDFSKSGIKIEGILYAWALDTSVHQQGKILKPFFYLVKNISLLTSGTSVQNVLPKLVLVTTNSVPMENRDVSGFHSSTLWGFCRSLRNEMTDLNARSVDVPDDKETSVSEMLFEMFSTDRQENQVVYQDHVRYVPKFLPYIPGNQEQPLLLPRGIDRFQLLHPKSRAISDLEFGVLKQFDLLDDELEIQVKYFGLNFRDLLNIIKPTKLFYGGDFDTVGVDYSGVVTRIGHKVTKWNVGDKVLGVNFNKNALPSHLKLQQDYVLPVPHGISLAQASTLPIVFATVYKCLVDVAKIKPVDTVLIHTASGGVGLCAIYVCRQFGVTNIITTAGSKRKQNYLRNLGIKHVFNSRNTSYAEDILRVTNERGVDVVLNSLTGEGYKEASLSVCAKGAWFLEMSKLSIWTIDEIQNLRPDVKYYIYDVDYLELIKICRRSLQHWFIKNRLPSPLPIVSFDATRIRQALMLFQKTSQIGKVVCIMPEWSVEKSERKLSIPMFNDGSSYLITGGLGGIGFLVCQWMIKKGARNIVLVGRSSPSDGIKDTITRLTEEYKCRIEVLLLDIGDEWECRTLFVEKIPELSIPPVRGIMHCAGILCDGLIVNQTWERINCLLNAKVNGTLNLHKFTRNQHLDHFVLFSSVAALIGPSGISNHAAACLFEDTFAFYRHSIGLPATTINWGQWGQVGIAMEKDFPGIPPITNLQGLEALEHIMKTHRIQTCVQNVDSFVLWSKWLPQLTGYLDVRITKSLVEGNQTKSAIKANEFWQQYDSAKDKEAVLKRYIIGIIISVLRLEQDDKMKTNVDLHELGVDSLMYVEIKNALQNLFGERFALSTNALRECNTIDEFCSVLLTLIEGNHKENLLETMPTSSEISELIRKDCILSEYIGAKSGMTPIVPTGEIRAVLLTGVTGNVGLYILRELLQMEHINKIFCLIRPIKNMSMKTRLNQNIEKRELNGSFKMLNLSKIELVAGNIAFPNLGLKDSLYYYLAQNVHAIFHCAAKVHHLEYYRERSQNAEDVRNVNIGGTKNILEFSCTTRMKYVFHSSSLLSVVTSNEEGGLNENWPEIGDYDGVTVLAYPISKFVEDVLYKQAVLERGLPCKVFRLPYLCGDSETGNFPNDQDHLIRRCIFIMKNGVMPDIPLPLLVLPVDIVTHVMVKLALMDNVPFDVYNITPDKPESDEQFPELAAKFGFSIQVVTFSEFSRKVLEARSNCKIEYHPVLKDLYQNEENSQSHFDAFNSAYKIWMDGYKKNEFFKSAKLQKYIPTFYENLVSTFSFVEKDLEFAQRQGLF